MMKRLYICILLLTMVSTAVIAQDVQQKDDAKKEAKAAKPKKEKKVKEPKAKKEKAPKAEKASSKAAAKTSISTKTSKKVKKDTPEYDASLRASKIAMDSILKYRTKDGPDDLMKFADVQCEKFGWDPVLMDSIAESFYTIYNNEIYGERRYNALKKMHPEYTQAYLSEARLFHSMAWYYENGDPNKLKLKKDLLEKCKIKIDSAKIVMPNSAEPYILWCNLQAKYKHYNDTLNVESIDEELEALKKKMPDYPGYRDVALYYEEILAKKDKNFLLDAAEYYEKAGDHNELTASHWNNFAILIFQYYRSFPKEDYGINIANKALELFPNYPPLLRAKLWNLGAYKKWDDILKMSETYFELTDSLQPSFNDYKFIAQAYENKKRYSEAIESYTKELEFVNDTTERLRVMSSLIKCNNQLSRYDEAINVFKEFESLKKATGKIVEYADYNDIINTHLYLATDTTLTKEIRLEHFDKADSLCAISAIASPEYITNINYRRLLYILINKFRLQYGKFSGDEIQLPEAIEAAERLYKSAEEKVNREDVDYYYMMCGYNYAMQHYLFKKDEENAYLISEKMLSLDMPSDIELQGISAGRRSEYAGWGDNAAQLNAQFSAKYGKKKGKKK